MTKYYIYKDNTGNLPYHVISGEEWPDGKLENVL